MSTATSYSEAVAAALSVVDALGSTAGDICAVALRQRHSRWDCPEVHLAFAILSQAIHDATSRPRDGSKAKALHDASREQRDALEFIQHDGEEPFSFAYCCDVCGLDAQTLRIAVMARKVRARAPRKYCSGRYPVMQQGKSQEVA